MSQYYFDPFFEALDSSGRNIVGAKLQFYDNNTTTPKDTFTDATLTIPNSNPVIANGSGRFPEMYLDGLYSIRFMDANDVLIKTIDDFAGAITAAVQSLTVEAPIVNTGTLTDPIIGFDPILLATIQSNIDTSTWLHFL